MGENINKPKGVRWYAVTTQSGNEAKVKENIDQRIQNIPNMNKLIFQTLVVEQEVPVLKKGVPTGSTKIKNIYPRYIFVEMLMTDDAWFVVRNTPGVTGIVGSSGKGTKPTPVTNAEIDRILKMCGKFDENIYSKYHVGDEVRILKGIYQDLKGKIVSVDVNTNQIEVEVTIMGRVAKACFPFTDVDSL